MFCMLCFDSVAKVILSYSTWIRVLFCTILYYFVHEAKLLISVIH